MRRQAPAGAVSHAAGAGCHGQTSKQGDLGGRRRLAGAAWRRQQICSGGAGWPAGTTSHPRGLVVPELMPAVVVLRRAADRLSSGTVRAACSKRRGRPRQRRCSARVQASAVAPVSVLGLQVRMQGLPHQEVDE